MPACLRMLVWCLLAGTACAPAAVFAAESEHTGPAGSPVSFELDVMPILTARGYNQGACHGKARGQNGFQLSLLGFDPAFDYAALTQQARGRRVFRAAEPDDTLELRQPRPDAFQQRRKLGISEEPARGGMVRGPGDLLGVDARIERVEHEPRAGHRVIELEMPVLVPGERGDPVPTGEAQAAERVREAPCARERLPVRLTMAGRIGRRPVQKDPERPL